MDENLDTMELGPDETEVIDWDVEADVEGMRQLQEAGLSWC